MRLAMEEGPLFRLEVDAMKPSANVDLESRLHLWKFPALAEKVRVWF
jgi:hypothetical protein